MPLEPAVRSGSRTDDGQADALQRTTGPGTAACAAWLASVVLVSPRTNTEWTREHPAVLGAAVSAGVPGVAVLCWTGRAGTGAVTLE